MRRGRWLKMFLRIIAQILVLCATGRVTVWAPPPLEFYFDHWSFVQNYWQSLSGNALSDSNCIALREMSLYLIFQKNRRLVTTSGDSCHQCLEQMSGGFVESLNIRPIPFNASLYIPQFTLISRDTMIERTVYMPSRQRLSDLLARCNVVDWPHADG